MPNVEQLAAMAEHEFSEIVESTEITRNQLRVILTDESFIDFWWSSEIPGRFACHWERTHIDGKTFCHNNMPHPQWQTIKTFPKHFHDGDSGRVIESSLSDDPETAVRDFLNYARIRLQRNQ